MRRTPGAARPALTAALALALAAASIASSLLLAGCGNDALPAAGSKPGSETSAKTVPVPPAQRQFLTIEAVGATQAATVLALPGRVTFRPQAPVCGQRVRGRPRGRRAGPCWRSGQGRRPAADDR